MPKKVFISYRHHQADWVRDRLVPCLRYGGAEVIIDYEKFGAGRTVVGEMDGYQDAADCAVLVLTPDYLASDFCIHEMERALQRNQPIVPIVRATCAVPAEINQRIWIDLCDDGSAAPWDKVLAGCEADLGADAPVWLRARDEILDSFHRSESVNLVVFENPKWKELIEHVYNDYINDLGIVNMDRGKASARHGLIGEMLLKGCGYTKSIPSAPDDLIVLDEILSSRPLTRLALLQIDHIYHRLDYGIDLFSALRYLIMDERRLVLLVQSFQPFIELLPHDHRLSSITFRTVELRGKIMGSRKPSNPRDLNNVPLNKPLSGLFNNKLRRNRFVSWARKIFEFTYPKHDAPLFSELQTSLSNIAREASLLQNLRQLEQVLDKLPINDNIHSSEVRLLGECINNICRIQARLDTVQLPLFRELIAEQLCQEITIFRLRVVEFGEPLATEFGNAANSWFKIAEHQLKTTRQLALLEIYPQVLRAGDPVDREQVAFIPRYSVLSDIEQQIMQGTGSVGFIIYGRRRTGKSTILRNLTGFLPLEVLTVNVSMQNPSLAASLPSFASTLAEQVQTQAPGLKLNEPLPDDLPGLFRFMTTVNDKLAAEQKRLLLAVDEYEALDAKIGVGVFPHDLLDTLRESIQTHRRLTWIFAGSHEITELPHAAWTSALVSARTIEVPAFTLAETRLLLTEPLKHSSLWRGNEAKRPRFDAAFWGTEEGSGIDYIHAQAGGWPHLVQLIAETLVDLVNEEEAHAVTPALLQRALDKAIVRGHNVLYELLRRECTLPGEWEYLERFKKLNAQSAPENEAIALSLRRRELMAIDGGEWRLRVPLMERWLRVRG